MDKLQQLESTISRMSREMARLQVRIDKLENPSSAPRDPNEWPDLFIKKHGAQVYNYILQNLGNWVSKGGIPVDEFMRECIPFDMMPRTFVAALDDFCQNEGVEFIRGVSVNLGKKQVRVHLFKNRKG